MPFVAELILSKRVVGIAIQPALSRLSRCNYRMTTRACMLRRMPVWRTIATPRGATLLASAQVHPLRTDLHTFFTNPLLRLLDFINRIDMNTYFCCHPASIQAERCNLPVDCDRNTHNHYPTVDPSSTTAGRSCPQRESHRFRQRRTI